MKKKKKKIRELLLENKFIKFLNNYYVYIVLFIVGMCIVLLGVLPPISFLNENQKSFFSTDQLNNFCLSVGTGFIASAIVALFGELNNDKRKVIKDTKFKKELLIDLNFLIEGFLVELDVEVFIDQLIKNPRNISDAILECEKVQYIGNTIFNRDEYSTLLAIHNSMINIENRVKEIIKDSLHIKHPDFFYDSILDNWDMELSQYSRHYKINNKFDVPFDDTVTIEFFRISAVNLRDNLKIYVNVFKLKK